MTARGFSALAYQMLAVAVGWQMYALTGSAFYLGLVGLVQFLPMIVLTLVSGHVADRYNRKMIISVSQVVAGLGVLLLVLGNYSGWISKESILVFIFIIGIANSFQGPSMQALLPNVVSRDAFPRAAALMASVWQFAVIVGPGLGGILYAFGPTAVYAITGASLFLSSAVILFVSVANGEVKAEYRSLKTVFAGVSYIRSKPAILGAISLDLFAVLFGGATALLPVYASTILNIGPFGLGVLRSAPAAGALLTTVLLARKPLRGRIGRTMFTAVIFFGIATIIFAVSTSFAISLLALFVLGASDAISVVIRSTFVQIETPDALRGRVSSVNQLFIGTSNQLGEFESGVTATWFGTVPAVLIGGIGTVVVALLWMRLFPALLNIDRLES